MTAYTLKNIQVNYANQCALDIPTLEIPAGKITTLLGSNGAGKSSLIRLLAFIQAPQQGQISFFQEAVKSTPSSEQRKKIGYVAQTPYLLKGSVLDNVLLALKLQKIERRYRYDLAQNALSQVGLAALQNQANHTLSGGQLKQAAIARAIAYQPDVLLLDEPFSHLDQQNNQLLENIIHDYAQQHDKTVIFSTHNQSQGLSIADNTVCLVNGKLGANPLVNLFHGSVINKQFSTGKIKINIAENNSTARHLVIDPREIIISNQPLRSSMQNNFSGRLTSIIEESNNIRVTIDCSVRFHAIITHKALKSLKLSVGDTVWLSFKSTVVQVF